MKGAHGDPLPSQGKVLHDDCSTPHQNAKIELWHCDGSGVYDHESKDFKYRGTTYSDDKGATATTKAAAGSDGNRIRQH